MNVFLSAFAPENLVSRDGFGSPVPRQPAHLHAQAKSGAYLRDSSRVPRRRYMDCCLYSCSSQTVPTRKLVRLPPLLSPVKMARKPCKVSPRKACHSRVQDERLLAAFPASLLLFSRLSSVVGPHFPKSTTSTENGTHLRRLDVYSTLCTAVLLVHVCRGGKWTLRFSAYQKNPPPPPPPRISL